MSRQVFGNIVLNVRQWGSGEPLVLVHGIGAGSDLWLLQVENLSKYFHVIAVDLRGFGRSDRPRGDHNYSLPIMAEDIRNVIRTLDLGPVHFLGTSLGGFIAQYLYATGPEDFRSLLLCHTAGQMTMPDHVIQARLTAIESMSMDDYAQMVVNQAVGPKAGEFAREWISEILARNDPEIYGTVLKNVLCGFDMADQLSKIRVPTLVLVGESDQVIPVESGLRLAEEIPNTELAVISDAGHVSYVEQPAAFQKSILSFLT